MFGSKRLTAQVRMLEIRPKGRYVLFKLERLNARLNSPSLKFNFLVLFSCAVPPEFHGLHRIGLMYIVY